MALTESFNGLVGVRRESIRTKVLEYMNSRTGATDISVKAIHETLGIIIIIDISWNRPTVFHRLIIANASLKSLNSFGLDAPRYLAEVDSVDAIRELLEEAGPGKPNGGSNVLFTQDLMD